MLVIDLYYLFIKFQENNESRWISRGTGLNILLQSASQLDTLSGAQFHLMVLKCVEHAKCLYVQCMQCTLFSSDQNDRISCRCCWALTLQFAASKMWMKKKQNQFESNEKKTPFHLMVYCCFHVWIFALSFFNTEFCIWNADIYKYAYVLNYIGQMNIFFLRMLGKTMSWHSYFA